MSIKQPPSPRFGNLLTEAISSVAKRKRLNMEVIEEEIALAVSRTEERETPLSFYTVPAVDARPSAQQPAPDDRAGLLHSLRAHWPRSGAQYRH
jgi:hypothetical protein